MEGTALIREGWWEQSENQQYIFGHRGLSDLVDKQNLENSRNTKRNCN
jgi:hypothetical protein